MGRLVVIEGLDGAGKRTLADALATALAGQGASVGRLAFPRYGADIHADLVRDALHGALGDLADSVHGMALLFALDRRAAKDVVTELLRTNDVLLADRYIASNAAYGAARLRQDAEGELVAWVHALEVDRFGLPTPHAHLLLRVPPDVAAARAEHRERTEADRRRDSFESDDGLQARCALLYDELAARDWLAPWHVVDGTHPVDTLPQDMAVLAKTLLR